MQAYAVYNDDTKSFYPPRIIVPKIWSRASDAKRKISKVVDRAHRRGGNIPTLRVVKIKVELVEEAS